MKTLLIVALSMMMVGCTQFKKLTGTDEPEKETNVCDQPNLDYTVHHECIIGALAVRP